MENKFLFTVGIVGMLSGVASGATDRAELDYDREFRPYITLRGGWLFGGDVKGDWASTGYPDNNRSLEKDIKSTWSGSGEFGVSCFDDRVFVGLELGYFTGKATFEELPFDAVGDGMLSPAEFGNTFGACNVMLRYYCGERVFGTAASALGLRVFP